MRSGDRGGLYIAQKLLDMSEMLFELDIAIATGEVAFDVGGVGLHII